MPIATGAVFLQSNLLSSLASLCILGTSASLAIALEANRMKRGLIDLLPLLIRLRFSMLMSSFDLANKADEVEACFSSSRGGYYSSLRVAAAK